MIRCGVSLRGSLVDASPRGSYWWGPQQARSGFRGTLRRSAVSNVKEVDGRWAFRKCRFSRRISLWPLGMVRGVCSAPSRSVICRTAWRRARVAPSRVRFLGKLSGSLRACDGFLRLYASRVQALTPLVVVAWMLPTPARVARARLTSAIAFAVNQAAKFIPIRARQVPKKSVRGRTTR